MEAPKNAIVWVAGGRDYNDAHRVDYVLDQYNKKHKIRKIITGAGRGADQLAEDWAKKHGIDYSGFPARWDAQGRAAGPIRNQRIADESGFDVLIAFPGGAGTKDAIEKAKAAAKPVFEIA